jgi:tetratricopeptide (TPR) repeat protein
MPYFVKNNLHLLLHLALIAALGTLIYSNTFNVPFVYDDTNFIVGNQLIKDFKYFMDSTMVEYRVYLSSTGFFIAIVSLSAIFIIRTDTRIIKRVAVLIAALTIISLSLAAYARNNVYKALGQSEQAFDHYDRALILKPDYAEAHNNIGLLYGFKGQTDKTIEHIQKALALKPDYAEAHYNIGLTYITIGNLEKAKIEFRAALKINPDYKKAIMHLERIEQDER